MTTPNENQQSDTPRTDAVADVSNNHNMPDDNQAYHHVLSHARTLERELNDSERHVRVLQKMNDDFREEHTQLRAQLAEAQADSRRLDWCDRNPQPDFSQVGNDSGWDMRHAIDQAIAQKEKQP